MEECFIQNVEHSFFVQSYEERRHILCQYKRYENQNTESMNIENQEVLNSDLHVWITSLNDKILLKIYFLNSTFCTTAFLLVF